MKTEIISVGTEILLGDIVNTNANFLAKELANLGIDVFFISSVGDNLQRIQGVFALACQRSDLVFVTGGLGPTEDDITREALCNVLGISLTKDQNEISRIQGFFKNRNLEMPSNNIRQALIPEGALILKNNYGTASGLIVKSDHKYFILLPGPPAEMKNIFTDEVVPWLKANVARKDYLLKSHTLKFIGISESKLDLVLNDLLKYQNPTLALLAKSDAIHLRITAKVASENEFFELTKPVEDEIMARVGKYYYGSDSETLEQLVGSLLTQKKLTVSTAESCTGGLIAKRFTDISGSSNYFLGGIIAYDNRVKEQILKVSPGILASDGAVSERTALAMAEGARKILGSDLAIATTGIAGPNGGSSAKPVGLVYISVVGQNINICKRYIFSGDRATVRYRAGTWALNLLKRSLEEA
ncbi:MAG: competence/damage-inducible protein A [Peptococcaceae bacterium]